MSPGRSSGGGVGGLLLLLGLTMMVVVVVEAVSVDETEAEDSLEVLEDDASTEILVRTDHI